MPRRALPRFPRRRRACCRSWPPPTPSSSSLHPTTQPSRPPSRVGGWGQRVGGVRVHVGTTGACVRGWEGWLAGLSADVVGRDVCFLACVVCSCTCYATQARKAAPFPAPHCQTRLLCSGPFPPHTRVLPPPGVPHRPCCPCSAPLTRPEPERGPAAGRPGAAARHCGVPCGPGARADHRPAHLGRPLAHAGPRAAAGGGWVAHGVGGASGGRRSGGW